MLLCGWARHARACVSSLASGSLLKGWPSHASWLHGILECASKGGVLRRFVYAAAAKLGQGSTTYGMLKTGQMDRYCLKPNPRTATYYRLNPGAPPTWCTVAAWPRICAATSCSPGSALPCACMAVMGTRACSEGSAAMSGLGLVTCYMQSRSKFIFEFRVTGAAGRPQTAARTARWTCRRRRRRPRRRC